jgi:Rod binding domain-containing protein
MTISGIGAGPLAQAVPAFQSSTQKQPTKIEEAASQFEALLVAQLLRQYRESAASDSGDDSGNHLMGFAEEQLAQVLSAQGGLGIARMASASLVPPVAAHPSVPASDQPAKLHEE